MVLERRLLDSCLMGKIEIRMGSCSGSSPNFILLRELNVRLLSAP